MTIPAFDPATHPRLAAMLYIGAFIATTLVISEISAYRKRRRDARDREWIASLTEPRDRTNR